MKVIKPETVGHFGSKNSRHSIYSLDFQPNGSRLATGGGDSQVKLYDTFSLLGTSEKVEDSLLSTLPSHGGSVNIVRWCKQGKYLASGSDDTYIFVYKYSSLPIAGGSSFGSSSQHQTNLSKSKRVKENWARCFTLQGHTMDVLDLDWCNNGLLASGSIDNNVLIWDIHQDKNTNNTSLFSTNTNAQRNNRNNMVSSILSPIRRLTGHESFVKGVSFDPIMKYLATIGSDNHLILWNIESWNEEPLQDSSERTMFSRLSWAPDGSSLCVSSAIKSCKPISFVLKRNTWTSVADLVGHNSDTVCCRFLPNMLQHPVYSENILKENKELIMNGDNNSNTPHTTDANSIVTSELHPSCFIAVGDMQGTLSVWTSSRNRTLVAFKDAFDGSVTDIAWCNITLHNDHSSSTAAGNNTSQESNSRHLIMCASSTEGRIILVDFSNLFGNELTDSEMDAHYELLYGSNRTNLLTTNSSSATSMLSSNDILEDIQLNLQSNKITNTNTNTNNSKLYDNHIQLSYMKNSTSTKNAHAVITNSSTAYNSNNHNNNENNHQLTTTATAIPTQSNSDNNMISHTGNLSAETILAMQSMTQSKSKSGKKRVCPIMLQSAADEVEAPILNSSSLPLPSSCETNQITIADSNENINGSNDKRVRFEANNNNNNHTIIMNKMDHMNARLDSNIDASGLVSVAANGVTNNNTSSNTGNFNNNKQINASVIRSATINNNSNNNINNSSNMTTNCIPPCRVLTLTFKNNDFICAVPLLLSPDDNENIRGQNVNNHRSLTNTTNNANNAITSKFKTRMFVQVKQWQYKSFYSFTNKTETTTSTNNNIIGNRHILSSSIDVSKGIVSLLSKQNTSSSNIENIYILKAQCLSKPSYLKNFLSDSKDLFTNRNSGFDISNVTNISLYDSLSINQCENLNTATVNNNHSNCKTNENDHAYWHTVVVGEVTCMCAQRFPKSIINAVNAKSNTASVKSVFSRSYGIGLDFDMNDSTTSNNNSVPNEFPYGVCAVGCSDGSLHILSLACGMKISPPLILGLPIVHVDIINIINHNTNNKNVNNSSNNADSSSADNTSNSNNHNHQHNELPFTMSYPTYNTTNTNNDNNNHNNNSTEIRLMACTADGDIYMWRINRNICNDSISLFALYRTSIKSPIHSMRSFLTTQESTPTTISDNTANAITNKPSKKSSNNVIHTSSLEKCALDSRGLPIIVLTIYTENSNSTATSSSSTTTTNQSNKRLYQAFRYEPIMQVWVRIADMRHSLSNLFTVSNIPLCNLSSKITGNSIQGPIVNNKTNNHLEILYDNLSDNYINIQNDISIQNGFDTSSVIKLAKLNSSVEQEFMKIQSKLSEKNAMNNIQIAEDQSTNEISASSSSQNVKNTPLVNNRNIDNESETIYKLKTWFDAITMSHIEEQLSIAIMTDSSYDIYKWFGEWIFLCSKNNYLQKLKYIIDTLLQDVKRHIDTQSNLSKNASITVSTQTFKENDIEFVSESNTPLYLLKYIVVPAIESSNNAKTLLNQLKDSIANFFEI